VFENNEVKAFFLLLTRKKYLNYLQKPKLLFSNTMFENATTPQDGNKG
jgi:hypothetical protein